MKRNFNNIFTPTLIGSIIAAIIVLIISPFIAFWCGYFIGWLSTFMVGDHLIKACSLIKLNIAKEDLKLISGLIGWVAGCFFAHYNTNKGK